MNITRRNIARATIGACGPVALIAGSSFVAPAEAAPTVTWMDCTIYSYAPDVYNGKVRGGGGMNCDAGHPGVFHTYLDKYNSNTGQWVESAHNSFTTSNASVQLDALAGCPGGPGLYRSRTWFDAVNYYDEPVAVTGGVTRTC